jgi:dihydrofolate reductase
VRRGRGVAAPHCVSGVEVVHTAEGCVPYLLLTSPKVAKSPHFAARTPHIVLSRTLDKVAWKNTRIVRDVEEIRQMQQQPGKDMHAVGGATLVGSLMNRGLIDELRLVVHPTVLGGGKPLFKDVTERHALKFLGAKPLESGLVRLTYSACNRSRSP